MFCPVYATQYKFLTLLVFQSTCSVTNTLCTAIKSRSKRSNTNSNSEVTMTCPTQHLNMYACTEEGTQLPFYVAICIELWSATAVSVSVQFVISAQSLNGCSTQDEMATGCFYLLCYYVQYLTLTVHVAFNPCRLNCKM